MAFAYWVNGNELELEYWQITLDFFIIILLSIFYTHQLKRTLNKLIGIGTLVALVKYFFY
jgi:hypothetical protein